MDPSPVILVWRHKVGGDELLQFVDGKGWRLPYATEVGMRRHPVEHGPIAFVAQAPNGFDPGRMHRWVPIEGSGYDVAHAWMSDPS